MALRSVEGGPRRGPVCWNIYNIYNNNKPPYPPKISSASGSPAPPTRRVPLAGRGHAAAILPPASACRRAALSAPPRDAGSHSRPLPRRTVNPSPLPPQPPNFGRLRRCVRRSCFLCLPSRLLLPAAESLPLAAAPPPRGPAAEPSPPVGRSAAFAGHGASSPLCPPAVEPLPLAAALAGRGASPVRRSASSAGAGRGAASFRRPRRRLRPSLSLLAAAPAPASSTRGRRPRSRLRPQPRLLRRRQQRSLRPEPRLLPPAAEPPLPPSRPRSSLFVALAAPYVPASGRRLPRRHSCVFASYRAVAPRSHLRPLAIAPPLRRVRYLPCRRSALLPEAAGRRSATPGAVAVYRDAATPRSRFRPPAATPPLRRRRGLLGCHPALPLPAAGRRAATPTRSPLAVPLLLATVLLLPHAVAGCRAAASGCHAAGPARTRRPMFPWALDGSRAHPFPARSPHAVLLPALTRMLASHHAAARMRSLPCRRPVAPASALIRCRTAQRSALPRWHASSADRALPRARAVAHHCHHELPMHRLGRPSPRPPSARAAVARVPA
ncbi:WAS/WASL-interacting protein family member 1-like [Panicum virgatum]|uniref:WAS/WASL-interacting protein family member 1-like n=1 Tax=Panicum virgatum TaxID=38727 RepID=UPI0019D59948|nr:WAS/WASL-interacting protein family member 1-like [Panicum virgatum]